jgi:hypothetical protein
MPMTERHSPSEARKRAGQSPEFFLPRAESCL